MNIGLADSVITQYEYQLLEKYFELEKTPSKTALTVGALSQMWVFALYEILRQWRDRKYQFKKWFDNGAIDDKIQQLSKGDDLNLAQNIRSHQLEDYRNSQELRQTLDKQWYLLEPIYRKVELYRMNLAKHCAPGKDNLLPSSPGYGRINMLCGAMDYELINKDGSYDVLNRRDIADGLREVFSQV
ncbi:hypothetical protein H6G59_11990 [Anabaena lutea FACHB-196]|uniref:Uncharacterized protein n=2 Tax=Anabaena TaxID=1163 RepID=A0ABR8FFU0_9NOST|nr:hypothetical protein [Anabaena lutea FACHB-196]